MWCTICNTHISQCTCDDLEERLRSFAERPNAKFAYRYCKKCDRHYEKCQCEEPDWGIRGAPEEKNKKTKVRKSDG